MGQLLKAQNWASHNARNARILLLHYWCFSEGEESVCSALLEKEKGKKTALPKACAAGGKGSFPELQVGAETAQQCSSTLLSAQLPYAMHSMIDPYCSLE